MKNFKNKQPIELTEEETYELVKQISEIEYSKNSSTRFYQDAEDGAIEFLTYSLEKDRKNKKGLNNYYRTLNMSHFKNLVHMEIRNGINYQFRKGKVKKLILESESLDKIAYESSDNHTTIGDMIPDEQYTNDINNNLELDAILSKISDENDDSLYIKLGNEISPFNYRNLTRLYYDFSSNKKLNSSDFTGVLYNKETDTALEENEIKKIINKYKAYLKKNYILGGATV